MANFATYESVQTLGNIPKVGDSKIAPHLPMAKSDAVDIISQETYDSIYAKSNPYTQDDYDKMKTAESYQVLSYLMPALNTESTGSGVTKATGHGDSRKENLSEFDLEKIITRFRDNAMKIFKKYVKVVDADEDGSPDIVMTGSVQMACVGSDEEVCDE